MKNLNVVADLNSQRAADNDVKLLAFMGCEGNIVAALVRVAPNEKRFTNLILERRRKVVILHAVSVVDFKTLAASCDRI